MNRRNFITAAGISSVAAISRQPGFADEQAFDPTELSIASLQRALTSGTASSEGLTAAYLARIESFDQRGPALRSVLNVNPNAISIARALDAERRAQHIRGPLHGIPILVKDNIESSDPMPTTAGSYALARSLRSVDAPLVARLRAAGAILLGKTNLSEWANFRSTRSCSGWSGMGGQTRNAYWPARSPSGSSAGSGVATAASFCSAAIGTETNGSILSPASVNGIVGFKPTVGFISSQGVVPISPRQDTAGPMCRTVSDAVIVAQVIGQRPLGFGKHGTDIEAFRLKGVRIGVMPVSPSAHPGIVSSYSDARVALEHEGAVTIDLQSPSAFEEMDESEFEALLFEFKASINGYLATLDRSQVDCRTLADLIAFNIAHKEQELSLFGQEIFEMAQQRGALDDPAYRRALIKLTRTAQTEGLDSLLDFQGVEVLLAPSNGPADLIDPVWGDRRGGGFPHIASAAAIAGYPSLTAPAGLVMKLPVGVTFVAGRNQDGLLLQVARAYERAAHARVPPRLINEG